MEKESFVKKINSLVKNPKIKIELNRSKNKDIIFYTLYFTFERILKVDDFLKELSFIYKNEEIKKFREDRFIKLEDIFSRYAGESKDEGPDIAKEEAEKIASMYQKILTDKS